MRRGLLALVGGLMLITSNVAAAVTMGTWGGATATDPLGGYVDWTMVDSSVCWVGRPPVGYASRTPRIKITNNRDQPVTLEVDGSQVDVVKPMHAGGTPMPWMAMINIDGTQYRRTVLWPGDTCYMAAPMKSQRIAESEGWVVTGRAMEPLQGMHRGFIPVDGPTGPMGYLHQGGFTYLDACENDKIKYKNPGRQMLVSFDTDEDFTDCE